MTTHRHADPRIRRSTILTLAATWIVFVGLPPAGLAVIREAWMERLSRPEAQRQWDDFRIAMREQTGRDGPVQRKLPKSREPPELVWLRDYFGLACGAWLLFGSVLWGFTAFFAMGAAPLTCRGSGGPSVPPRERG